MTDYYVPPVPSSKFSEDQQRDFIIKEYLQKLKDKLDSIDTTIAAIASYVGYTG
jgi:hypothetical protein